MKRIPSNRMPQYLEPECGLRAYALIVIYCLGVGYMVWTAPWFISVGIVSAVTSFTIFENFKLKRIARERASESLCTFSRSFDYRSIDTWIIRAVYEQFLKEVGFPPRKLDRFTTLRLDEDIDIIAEQVAQRTGRSLTNCELNPWYGKVETVADMVEFFLHQPKLVPASQ